MDDAPQKPEPPSQPVAPLPPTFAGVTPPPISQPPAAHVPLTPMMDFLSRRLESLERELTLERERAQAAQALLQSQDSIRGEVEGQLKSMTEQLRREKSERETEEMRSRASGRIEALERRLDEMHQTWASLLKEALGHGEEKAVSAAAHAEADMAQVQGALGELRDQFSLWRDFLESFSRFAPELRSFVGRPQEPVLPELRELPARVAEAFPAKEFLAELRELPARVATPLLAELRGLADQIPKQLAVLDGSEDRLLRALKVELRGLADQWPRAIAPQLQRLEQAPAQLLVELRAALERVPERMAADLRALAERLPAPGRDLESELRGLLTQLAAQIQDRIAQWEKRQCAEFERQDERFAAFNREKTVLREALESRNHDLRQEFVREKIAQEASFERQVVELAAALGKLKDGQETWTREFGGLLKEAVAKLAPSAGNQITLDLQRENRELMSALRERGEALRKYVDERKQVEESMGNSLMQLNRELSAEREKSRQIPFRLSELEHELMVLKDKLEAAERMGAEKDARYGLLSAERDELLRGLTIEAAKVRQQIDERARAEQGWTDKVALLQKRLDEQTSKHVDESSLIGELRAQIATLTEQLTRAVREKESAAGRQGSWEIERREFLETLKKKEDLIATLSSTFQDLLKKQ